MKKKDNNKNIIIIGIYHPHDHVMSHTNIVIVLSVIIRVATQARWRMRSGWGRG